MKLQVLFEIQSGRVVAVSEASRHKCDYRPGPSQGAAVVDAPEIESLPPAESLSWEDGELIQNPRWPKLVPELLGTSLGTDDDGELTLDSEMEVSVAGIHADAPELKIELGRRCCGGFQVLAWVMLRRGESGTFWSWTGDDPSLLLHPLGLAPGLEIGVRSTEDDYHGESEMLVILLISKDGTPTILKGEKITPA